MLPFVIEPDRPRDCAQRLSHWMAEHSDWTGQKLAENGAVLFRGFPVAGVEDFSEAVSARNPNLMAYVGGGSPRSKICGGVYTSTEYAAHQHIPLHIEGSYFSQGPHFVWFHCETAPSDRGQTPLGDMRQMLDELPAKLVARFDEKGVVYISNLHAGNGFGRSWPEAYHSDDKQEVEAHLDQLGCEYEWLPDDRLRTFMSAPAIKTHSETGDRYWHNQAANWHPANHGEKTWQLLRATYGEEVNFPKSATFGDGSPIDPEDIAEINRVMTASETVFDWQQGDVLLLDNQWIAHGRQPFSGARKILVAMS